MSNETRHKYRIRDAFWNMIVNPKSGGAPDFMRLDIRAFQLDVGNSSQYNLYFSLINSATTDGIKQDRTYDLKLETLLRWAGLENTYPTPVRLRPVLRGWLDRCVALGLLDSWESTHLGEGPTTMAALYASTLHIVFSDSQSQTLPLQNDVQRARPKQFA